MEHIKIIRSERFILSFFRTLYGQKNVDVIVNYQNSKTAANMYFSSKRGSQPSIDMKNRSFPQIPSGREIEVILNSKEDVYSFKSRIAYSLDDLYDLEMPSVLHVFFRRHVPRYNIQKDDNLSIVFKNCNEKCKLRDISVKGISFISNKAVFHEDELIENAHIKLLDSNYVSFDGVVKFHKIYEDDKHLYGLSITDMGMKEHSLLFKYVYGSLYPNVRPVLEFSDKSILEVFKKSCASNGADGSKAEDKFIKSLDKFKTILQRPLISSSAAYLQDDRLLNMGIAVRIYDRTFLGNEIASIPETRLDPKPNSEVSVVLADNMLCNPNFEYYISYITKDIDQYSDTYQSVYSLIGDKSKYLYDRLQSLEFFCGEIRDIEKASGFTCELCEDPSGFIEFSGGALSLLEAGAYGYNFEHFKQQEIIGEFKAADVNITRKLWCVKDKGKAIAYAVSEILPEEIIFNGTHNLCRLHMERSCEMPDKVIGALLPELALFYQSQGKESFSIMVKELKYDAGSMNLKGIVKIRTVGRVIANKAGMLEYKKIIIGSLVRIPIYYRLTYTQMAIWNTEKVYPGTNFANISALVKIKEKVDFKLLDRAINLVIMKNEGLRLKFIDDEAEPKQYISKYKYQKAEFFDFSLSGGGERLSSWPELKKQAAFKLNETNLFYFSIFRVNEKEGGFYVKIHHLVCDAWTITNLIVSRIIEYYYLLKNGHKIDSRLAPSFIDYICIEEEYKESKRFLFQKEYWKNKFETLPELTALKSDNTEAYDLCAGRKLFKLPEELTARADAFCHSTKSSIFSFFLSVLAIYLSRITGKKDVVIGAPVLNRSNPKEKETVGMFVSVVPLRIALEEETDCCTFVNNVMKEWNQALRNQKYPYELILRDIREKHKDMGRLYDVVLSFQNTTLGKADTEYSSYWCFNGHMADSLAIHFSDRNKDGQYTLEIDYRTEYFTEKEMDRLYEYMKNIIGEMVDNPLKKINRINMLSAEEINELLNDFNNSKTDYPRDKTIKELFEEQAAKTPDNTAVVFENRQLTYRELNEKANQLAGVLTEYGIVSGQPIGLIIDRSVEMIVSVIGVLKAGCAYIPIDPGYPEERVQGILADSKAPVLISDTNTENRLDYKLDDAVRDLGCEVLMFDRMEYRMSCKPKENPRTDFKSESIAYIMYTSGSTGKPKGNLTTNYNIVRVVKNTNYIDITDQDTILQLSNYAFDGSTFDIFGSLLNGARLLLLSRETVIDIFRLSSIISNSGVTVFFVTTALFNTLVDVNLSCLKNVRKILFGGERVSVRHVQKAFEFLGANRLIHVYGPTESTTFATYYHIDSIDGGVSSVPIGRPVSNTQIFILDNDNALLPVGYPGELCISGDGLARGYLNRPELTGEKFVPNPFKDGEIMYRTGDLARWLPDGNIEFLDRMDTQVKLRGFRVELGEIEAKLLSHENIKEAVVTVREEAKESKHLCAYYVSDCEFPQSQLKEQLRKELPEFMIPSYFIRLDRMPINSNGKIDRSRLPEPKKNNEKAKEEDGPANAVEEKLAEVWREVLNLEKVGINDDFFEIGGDSLSAIRVLSGLIAYNWNITVQDFYNLKTIKGLADKINNNINDGRREEGNETAVAGKVGSIAAGINTGIKNIFLTGATGFLGMHILEQLIDEKTVEKVYCLVRGESHKAAEKKLAELLDFYFGGKYPELIGNKILIVNGDFTLERFGMEEQQYFELGEKIDSIIHTAALVKHFGNYADFYRVNVLGTENVIRFAERFSKRLNHISTLSVAGCGMQEDTKAGWFSENDFYIGQNYMYNVYVRSKFEAENLIFKSIRSGLNARIFRVGNLTGRYSDGHFQPNMSENNFYRVIKSIVELGAVSRKMSEDAMEFTPIDYCARGIVKLLKHTQSGSTVYHLYNHKTLSRRKFNDIIGNMGFDIRVLEDGAFEEYVNSVSMDKAKKGALNGLVNYFAYRDIGESSKAPVVINSDASMTRLKALDFEWPEVDEKYIKNIMEYMANTGFLSYNRNKYGNLRGRSK